MLQLKNNTPFSAHINVFPNEVGIDTLYIVVKASFNIAKKCSIVEKQAAVQLEDEYWGDPETSSIRYVSDIHTGKPATDIIMNGDAYTPGLKPVATFDVNLAVAHNKKTVRVFGDRIWNNNLISKPIPINTMPMIFERAYGGSFSKNDKLVSVYQKNPIGRGYTGSRHVNEVDNIMLPNLEDPEALILNHEDQPEVACFSSSASHWKPRSDYAGTYDESWCKNDAPYLPKDFNSLFLNSANTDLIVTGFLKGGEKIQISNMNEAGNLQFKLPIINLKNKIQIDNRVVTEKFNMETLILEPNILQFSTVWRAKMICDKKMLNIKNVTISMPR